MPAPALFLFLAHPIGWVVGIALALLPAIVAFARGHRHPWVILVLNLFLWWTLVVWVGTLIWALAGRSREEAALAHGSYTGMISPDGRWTWDGRRWVPLSGPPPPPR
jgi:hypothetical protein